MKTGWLVALVLLAGAGYGGWKGWQRWTARETRVSYRTVKVERGDVVQVVRATGTVQPIKLVQVGTQVNGIVQKLFVDFNSRVQAGDVVAQIDPAVYRANLAQSEANVARSQASVDDARAGLLKASNDLARATGLAARNLLAKSDLDNAIAGYASSEAQLKVALATVQQNAAALELARANLGYTRIVTPVDGIVVSRNVDEGQTVVASMSAQTLFTVATDLRTLLISASVPEADIGSVTTNQKVTFNVDAYPVTFTGTVGQIRLAASTVQNVVTYPVMVQADNPGEKLFPGMTANISCIVAERINVLKVANAALRFKPENSVGHTATNRPARVEGRGNGGPGGGGDQPRRHETAGTKKSGKLWTRSPDGALREIRVRLGISDGTATEVSGEELEENLEVIVGIQAADRETKTVNPFLQQPMGPGARPAR
jgi:HlyD family secretion protein